METKTEAKPDTGAPPVVGGSELSRMNSALERVTTWNKEQVDLIKRTVCPPETTDDEFALFLAQCQRTGLDPLIKEAFCVQRRKKVTTYKNGTPVDNWVNENVFQASEAGMRARASDYPDFRGLLYGVVHEGDKFEFHPGDGSKIEHSFNPADPARTKKPIMGAWAWCKCEGRVTAPVWIPLGERIQTTRDGKITSMWLKTETMIAKCARAEALRIAYPKKWGGTRIDAEFSAEETEVDVGGGSTESAKSASSRTDSVTAKVKAKTAAKPTPPSGQTVEDNRPRVEFGPLKGKVIADLSADELNNAEQVGLELLEKNPGANWLPKLKKCLEALAAERGARLAKASTAPPAGETPPPEDAEIVEEREPGSDG